jgi:hypothetical protein
MVLPFPLRRTQSQPNSPFEESLEQARQKMSLIFHGSEAGSTEPFIRHGMFGGTEILGTEFRDIAGTRGWVFAFWSERDPRVRLCFASRGEMPQHIPSSDRENLHTAKTAWEACSGTMPN